MKLLTIILDEVKTLFFAGHHTTAIIASVILRILASLPEIQEKVRHEIYQIFHDVDLEAEPITDKDLCKMVYLERVIKETLRLFPSAPSIVRQVTEDFNIGEYTLPEGSTLMIPIFHIHRNKKLWHNPLKFDPDRFLPEEIAKRHKMSYIPFSAGPRNCIGNKFAIMTLKILISTILRKYAVECDDMTPIGKIKVKTKITIQPVKPIKIRIKKLNLKETGYLSN